MHTRTTSQLCMIMYPLAICLDVWRSFFPRATRSKKKIKQLRYLNTSIYIYIIYSYFEDFFISFSLHIGLHIGLTWVCSWNFVCQVESVPGHSAGLAPDLQNSAIHHTFQRSSGPLEQSVQRLPKFVPSLVLPRCPNSTGDFDGMWVKHGWNTAIEQYIIIHHNITLLILLYLYTVCISTHLTFLFREKMPWHSV